MIDPVSGVAIHRSGGVVASCSGKDYFDRHTGLEANDPGPSLHDPSLKIWSLST